MGGGGIISVVTVNGTAIGGNETDGDPKPGPVYRVLREMLAAGELTLVLQSQAFFGFIAAPWWKLP